jgi:hypothetical protein
MVVKVYDTEGDWHLFDGIDKVHCSDIYYELGSTIIGDLVVMKNNNKQRRNLKKLCCVKFGVAPDVIIYFETTAYICNDNGRTIERISVSNSVT